MINVPTEIFSRQGLSVRKVMDSESPRCCSLDAGHRFCDDERPDSLTCDLQCKKRHEQKERLLGQRAHAERVGQFEARADTLKEAICNETADQG
jgi:hypothetical protein